jgi:hypothetical protein
LAATVARRRRLGKPAGCWFLAQRVLPIFARRESRSNRKGAKDAKKSNVLCAIIA